MILSKFQQLRFWREWSAACRAQGWTKAQSWTGAQIDNERHALLERCGFDSLTKVDKQSGFDRVLAELALLTQPDNLKPQLNVADQPRIRLHYAIRAYGFAEPYIAAIARDRFNTDQWESLPLKQLEQLRNTLAARKSAHRAREVGRVTPCAPSPENEPF